MKYIAQNWFNGNGETVQITTGTDGLDWKIEPSDQKNENLLLPAFIDLHAVIQSKNPTINQAQSAYANGIANLLAMPGQSLDHQPITATLPQEQAQQKQTQTQAKIYQSQPLSLARGNTRVPLDYNSLDTNKVKALYATDADLLHTKALLRCLQLAKASNIPVFFQPNWAPLSQKGHAHQGTLAAQKGLDGVSPSAETIALHMMLELIRDTGATVHITGISSARSLAIINKAKQEDLNITASTPINNLIFCDQNIGDYDTNFKVWPPLRSEEDKQALQQAVRSGCIDAITSHHTPQTSTDKHQPFASASYGTETFDTFIPKLMQLVKDEVLTVDDIRKACALNPAGILRIDNPQKIMVNKENDTISQFST